MGSRFTALDLPEFLRPWRDLGVRFLYGLAPAFPPERPVEQPASRGAPAFRDERKTSPASTPKPFSGVLDSERQQPTAKPVARPAASPGNPFFMQAHEGELPPPWDAYLQRACKSPQVVFTYWGLHEDLGATPSTARRAIWARLLKRLAWPSGSVAFWPVCEPSGASVLARRDLFWRGVAEFGAHTVVVFGREAFMALFPDRPFACRAFAMHGLRFIVLPDPALLVAEDRQAMIQVVRALEAVRFE